MTTNEDSRPKTRNRMLLYIILAGVGFAMGNLTVEMFPGKAGHRARKAKRNRQRKTLRECRSPIAPAEESQLGRQTTPAEALTCHQGQRSRLPVGLGAKHQQTPTTTLYEAPRHDSRSRTRGMHN